MKVTTFDIFFQALILILDIHLIHSVTMAVPKRVGVIGQKNVSMECVFVMGDEERFSAFTWSRKRSSEQEFVNLAGKGSAGQVGYDPGGYSIRNRTVISFIGDTFTITYMDVRREDEATYRCTVKYYFNRNVLTHSAEMFFEVKEPSLNPYIIVGIVVGCIVAVLLIVAVIICISCWHLALGIGFAGAWFGCFRIEEVNNPRV
ncbi:uncharacterized protein LOC121373479 [Gigantopelta aegis]|uniref:uncharacterized protein LOC121373479 n=1 Tax=Gigantopelta aegis TaxID=1735272 RepID=UPI001B88C9EA|nr:uncharacterized protein LOC121373479 [Gigantopelta aegis]